MNTTNRTAIDALTDEQIDRLAEQNDLYSIQDGGRISRESLHDFARDIAALAPTVQGSVDVPTQSFDEWFSREFGRPHVMQKGEYKMAQLGFAAGRAALAQRAAVADASIPGLDNAFMTLESNGGTGRTIVLKFNQREDAYEVHSYLLKASTPTASTPPAPAEKGDCRMTGGICSCRSGGSYGGCRKERESCCATAPAPSEPAPQGYTITANKVGKDYPDGYLMPGLATAPTATSGGEAVAFGYVLQHDWRTDGWSLFKGGTEEQAARMRQVYPKVHMVYLAPPSLPAASEASVRDRALQEAAELAEDMNSHGAFIADAIRAMISKENGNGN